MATLAAQGAGYNNTLAVQSTDAANLQLFARVLTNIVGNADAIEQICSPDHRLVQPPGPPAFEQAQ